MIEVVRASCGRWAWTMISATGRVLVYRHGFPCDFTAFADAKAFRSANWAHSARIDWRMGAAI